MEYQTFRQDCRSYDNPVPPGIGRRALRFCAATTGKNMPADGFHTEPALDYAAWRASTQAQSMCGYSSQENIEAKGSAGTLRAGSICGFAGIDARSDIHRRVERTQRHIRLDDMDCYRAIFQIAGRSTVMQNDRVMELASGDLALVDTTRPTTYVSEGDRRIISLNLPRQTLISHLGLEPNGGLFKQGKTLAGRSLFRLVLDAVNESDPLLVPAEPYMRLAISDLLGALLAASDSSPVSSPVDKLFTRVCSIIKGHFFNPDIGPREVAAEAGISLRYLQKLFTVRGTTCSLFTQSLRLEHAARLLHGRALSKTNQPISEIAYACGFRNYTHFARAFRGRFGHPPGATGS